MSRSWNTIEGAARAAAKGEMYEVTAEECAELQQEGIQYYHRYLSLFQINDFEGVVRDTQRNLDLFTFVAEHTDREEFSWALQQFRPYVLMMNTRAKASILLGQGKFLKIAEIEWGVTSSAIFCSNPISESWCKEFGDRISRRVAQEAKASARFRN